MSTISSDLNDETNDSFDSSTNNIIMIANVNDATRTKQQFSQELTDLLAGTIYEVWIIAVGNHGSSPKNGASLNITMPSASEFSFVFIVNYL